MNTIVVAVQGQVSSDLGGEVVILSLEDGIYYGLDEVGARVWSLIQTPTAVASIRDAILEEYDVDAPQCEHDLLALLDDLAARGLVEVRNEKGL
jgi:hypothetical protein